jgi:predicted  nucleic acid-binding Zn-ribbon protein
MDANQLQELATNARLNHWPPHLGVRTEAEKMEYLANALDEVIQRDYQEALENQIETLEEEAADFENKIYAQDDKIEKLTDENERLRGELKAKSGESDV